MFLNLFNALWAAMQKNVKLTLLTILLVLLLSWGIYGEVRIKNMDEACEHRLANKENELREINKRLFDLFIAQQSQHMQTQKNDSLLREQTDKAVKHVLQ